MDLRLVGAVIKRHRRLVGGGAVLAVILAALSYGTPTLAGGKPTLKPRGAQVWESGAEILITEAGDPYGQAAPAVTQDEGYLSSLSAIYAAIANGDSVQTQLRLSGARGTMQAAEVIDTSTGNPLPLVTLTATASTAEQAAKTATETLTLLRNYVAQQQEQAQVSANHRVVLEVLRNGQPPVLAAGHKYTLPMLVFVAVLGAVFTLAFMRENVDPRVAVELGRVPALATDRLRGMTGRHDPGRQSNGALTSVNNQQHADPPGAGEGLRKRLLRN